MNSVNTMLLDQCLHDMKLQQGDLHSIAEMRYEEYQGIKSSDTFPADDSGSTLMGGAVKRPAAERALDVEMVCDIYMHLYAKLHGDDAEFEVADVNKSSIKCYARANKCNDEIVHSDCMSAPCPV